MYDYVLRKLSNHEEANFEDEKEGPRMGKYETERARPMQVTITGDN